VSTELNSSPLVEISDDGKVFFCLDGQKYEVSPTNPFEELELIRQRATEARVDPQPAALKAMEALETLPPAAREAMATAINNRLIEDTQRWLNKAPATQQEIATYLDSEAGAAFTAWLRLRNNAGVDEVKAREIVKAVGLKAWLEHRDKMQKDLIEFARKQREAKEEAEREREEAEQKEQGSQTDKPPDETAAQSG